MRRAQWAELQHLLVVQDITLVVIAVLLAIGVIMLLVAAGSHGSEKPQRDIRDTYPGKPRPRR